MLIFRPCLKGAEVCGEEGPFFTIDVKPDSDPRYHVQERHKVVVHVRTETLKRVQLQNKLSSTDMRIGRRRHYSASLDRLEQLQDLHRKIKRVAATIPENHSLRQLLPKELVIHDDIADTLVMMRERHRDVIANIAALEIAGLSQTENMEYTAAAYRKGKQLADQIRENYSAALWINGADKAAERFDLLEDAIRTRPKQTKRAPAPRG